MEFHAPPPSTGWRFSLHALLGAHSAVAAVSKIIAEAPLLAGVVGTCVALVALQLGVLAACTRGLRARA